MSDEKPAEIERASEPSPTRSIKIGASMSRWSGPLPPPDELEGYDRVQSGLADRIVRMAEQQSEHRRSLERIVVEGGARRSDRGLTLGFALAMAFLVASVALILAGHAVAGTILGTVDLVTLVGIFVYSSQDVRKELREKAERQEALLRKTREE